MSGKNGVSKGPTTFDPNQDISISIATDRPVDEHAREVARVNDRGNELREQKAYVQRRLRALIDELTCSNERAVVADALTNAGEILRVEIERELRASRKKGIRK